MKISKMDTLIGSSVMSPLDISIFVASIAISVLIGFYFANKNKTFEDYMLGSRNQKLLPVSVSMMTSFISGLSIIGNPAEVYYNGFTYSTIILAQLLSIPFTALIFLPVFYRLGRVSVYDYLEKRFSRPVKQIVSLSFIFQMTLYNAVVLFVPSLSLQTILGISKTVSIGAVGISCLIYSTVGGLKAIIWTDFFQAGLMYLSVCCIAIFGMAEAGGFIKLMEINYEAGRFSVDNYFDLDLDTRHTIYTILSGALILNIFINGTSQIQVQRALSLPNLRLAQWSLLLSAIFVVLISSSCSFLGLVLTTVYKDCDPILTRQIEKPDSIIFQYITTHLIYIPGLRGLFVAGIFAATLSTLSSFQNSMSALLLEDFIKPNLPDGRQLSERIETFLGKLIALLFGCCCIGLTFLVGKVSGLLQIALTLYGALGAPFLSAFFLGMLTRFTNTLGISMGMLFGTAFGIFIQTYQTLHMVQIQHPMPISTIGCSVTTNTSFLDPVSLNISTSAERGFTESILGMSYLWLPLFVMMITCTIAIVVSILTGGLYQKIDEDCLVDWLQREIVIEDKCSVMRSPDCIITKIQKQQRRYNS